MWSTHTVVCTSGRMVSVIHRSCRKGWQLALGRVHSLPRGARGVYTRVVAGHGCVHRVRDVARAAHRVFSSGCACSSSGTGSYRGTNDVCEVCSSGGDLLQCDYCNAAWHNELACLKGSPQATSENDGDLWACPACWAEATKRFTMRARKRRRLDSAAGGAAAGGKRARR